MTSIANVQPTQFELTPCRVQLNGVDLGGTLEAVKVSINYEKAGELKADQYGSTVLDRKVTGFMAKVELTLAQIKDKALWKKAFPNADLVGTVPNQKLLFKSKVGQSDLALATKLVLHPLSRDDADKKGDLVFALAVPEEVTEVSFSSGEQQGLKCSFNIYLDTSTGIFMQHGDETIAATNAAASVVAFVGTGNGTLTSLVVANNYSKTEAISVKCIAIPGADDSIWEVRGALSGLIETLSITAGSANFAEGGIQFTLTDGSTDFVVDDEFTFTITAANYI